MREAGAGGTYEVVDGADHVLSWNVDPKAYEKAIKDFTKELDSGE